MDQKKTLDLNIEELEERIAPGIANGMPVYSGAGLLVPANPDAPGLMEGRVPQDRLGGPGTDISNADGRDGALFKAHGPSAS